MARGPGPGMYINQTRQLSTPEALRVVKPITNPRNPCSDISGQCDTVCTLLKAHHERLPVHRAEPLRARSVARPHPASRDALATPQADVGCSGS